LTPWAEPLRRRAASSLSDLVLRATRGKFAANDSQGDDANLLRVQFGAQLLPIGRRQAGQAVDLLDQENVAGPAVVDEAKQFGARELRAGFVLDVGSGDGEPMIGGESLDLAARVLFVGRSAEVGASVLGIAAKFERRRINERTAFGRASFGCPVLLKNRIKQERLGKSPNHVDGGLSIANRCGKAAWSWTVDCLS
jgi:hypothetical protein